MFCDCGKHVLRNDDKQRGKTGICRCTFKIKAKMRNGNGVNMEEKLTDRLFIELLTNTNLAQNQKIGFRDLRIILGSNKKLKANTFPARGFMIFLKNTLP